MSQSTEIPSFADQYDALNNTCKEANIQFLVFLQAHFEFVGYKSELDFSLYSKAKFSPGSCKIGECYQSQTSVHKRIK